MPETVRPAGSGRIPPNNIETEQALLGCMFLSTDVQIEASARLKPDDFYRPAHRTIFAAMLEMLADNKNFDHLSLADKLKSKKKLDEIGGQAYLLELSGAVPTTAYWETYADIVDKLSTYRRLITAGAHIVSIGYDAEDDVKEAVGQAETSILDVTEKQISNDFAKMSDQLIPVMDRIQERADAKGAIIGVPSGFRGLDKLTSGFRSGDLIILGARPAVGKTALALNIAANAARAGVHVAIFSLEMSTEDLVQRVACSEARVEGNRVRNGNLLESDWSALVAGMDRLSKLDIVIDDTPSLNITELRAKARRQFRGIDGQEKKGLIIVDYLQLMQPTSKRSENRQVEVSEISRGLKILAKNLHVPVMALSQVSREVEKRGNMRPQLADLRESGSIEQDADIVMFIDRNTDTSREGDSEDYSGGFTSGDDDRKKRPGPGEAFLMVAKHRNGETGDIPLHFEGRYTRFSDTTGARPD